MGYENPFRVKVFLTEPPKNILEVRIGARFTLLFLGAVMRVAAKVNFSLGNFITGIITPLTTCASHSLQSNVPKTYYSPHYNSLQTY